MKTPKQDRYGTSDMTDMNDTADMKENKVDLLKYYTYIQKFEVHFMLFYTSTPPNSRGKNNVLLHYIYLTGKAATLENLHTKSGGRSTQIIYIKVGSPAFNILLK